MSPGGRAAAGAFLPLRGLAARRHPHARPDGGLDFDFNIARTFASLDFLSSGHSAPAAAQVRPPTGSSEGRLVITPSRWSRRRSG
ncbi:hypothetical protein [Streptomyces mirabilis]|uniref:hypothetical protein n=1 Tax=Streptomyces mirabilis TaxID=68239 RepID=UPI00333358A0